MRLLTQNVLNYPEVLESSRCSSECLLFFVISIDNDLITEKQLVSREGVTELLKAQDQMQWVQRMNNNRIRAMEVVNNDLIYA
ncbi:MAG: TnpV protein [Oscillospiraceae bacterium]|nr:TnpV protein [Oscillospiraceae bacterium]